MNDADEAVVEGSDVQVDEFVRDNEHANGAVEDDAEPCGVNKNK